VNTPRSTSEQPSSPDREGAQTTHWLRDRRLRARHRRRALSFFLDWAIWGYVAYAVMFFLNYYWFTRMRIHWYDTLTLPAWGWALTIAATFELAVLCRAFGRSIGLRSFGLELVPADGQPTGVLRRLARILLWHLSVLPLAVGFWGPCEAPWHDRVLGLTLRVSRKRARGRDAADIGPEAQRPAKRAFATQWGVLGFLLGLLTLWLGWLVVQGNLSALVRRAGKAGDLFGQIARPDFRYFVQEDPTFALRKGGFSIVDLMVSTLLMTLLSTVVGTVIAFPLSFLGARNLTAKGPWGWLTYTVVRGFFNIFRAIETLLWATIFAVWVGWGSPLAGVLALTIHTIAALGKLFSEQVESIDAGPVEAIRAAGGNALQVIRYAVVPQVAPSFWAFTLYRWDINVRMSTIIALVGAGGIGNLLFYYKNEGLWSIVGAVVISIVVVVWAMDYLSGWLRERIVR